MTRGDFLITLKPIITIKEARKLLGKDFKHLSDDQIENIVVLLGTIAEDNIVDKVPN